MRCICHYTCGLPQTVDTIALTTWYGLQLLAGRRSSKYPRCWWNTCNGMRTEHPLLPTPHVNSVMGLVSCAPVRRSELCSPYTSMCSLCLACSCLQALIMCSNPPFLRIAHVEKLVWHPDPFQSPKYGLGWNETQQLYFSVIRHNK